MMATGSFYFALDRKTSWHPRRNLPLDLWTLVSRFALVLMPLTYIITSVIISGDFSIETTDVGGHVIELVDLLILFILHYLCLTVTWRSPILARLLLRLDDLDATITTLMDEEEIPEADRPRRPRHVRGDKVMIFMTIVLFSKVAALTLLITFQYFNLLQLCLIVPCMIVFTISVSISLIAYRSVFKLLAYDLQRAVFVLLPRNSEHIGDLTPTSRGGVRGSFPLDISSRQSKKRIGGAWIVTHNVDEPKMDFGGGVHDQGTGEMVSAEAMNRLGYICYMVGVCVCML